MKMTFKEKLNALHEESLSTQKEFLLVIQEIRGIAAKGEALPEELLFRRDKLYHQFNRVLKLHRRLVNYTTTNSILLDDEYTEDIYL
jgi:hypothetical protein